MSREPEAAQPSPRLPYVAPMAAFLILTSLEGQLPPGPSGGPHPTWYPLAYAAKVAIVAALAWFYRSTWRDYRPNSRPGPLALGTLVGLAVAFLWVTIDTRTPVLPFLGKRSAFNPDVLTPGAWAGFLAVRFFGLVVLVPVIEELFWRSFLMRWIIDPRFEAVPIGRVTPLAAAVTAGLFALAHPEWLAALLTGLAWAALLGRTRSLGACLVSHATANLALGFYVVATAQWKFL